MSDYAADKLRIWTGASVIKGNRLRDRMRGREERRLYGLLADETAN